MTRMTGRRAMLEMLRAEGVEYIFGNPGTSESPIMHELESFPELKYVLVLQEGVAVGMADAYARATGRPAFVNLHIETGLANGISLLHNAYAGGTPAGTQRGQQGTYASWPTAGPIWPIWCARSPSGRPRSPIPTRCRSWMRRAFNEAKTPPTGPDVRRVLRQRAGRRGGRRDRPVARRIRPAPPLSLRASRGRQSSWAPRQVPS